MLCDVCGKNQATVHLTEIINEQMTELHLCEQCAREKGAQMEQQFDLSDFLAGLADIGAQIPEGAGDVRCARCGMTYADFRKLGRLGCGDCYSSFRKNLAPLLKRIHGSSHHTGKAPVSARKFTRLRDELAGLRVKLAHAIEGEHFEEAARIRDQIRTLEDRAEEEGKELGA